MSIIRNLLFLGVGRVQDATILATYSDFLETAQRETTEEVFGRLLEAARLKLSPGQRQRLQWNQGSVCCYLDPQGLCLYTVVTSTMEYPERWAFHMLQELMLHVNKTHGGALASLEAFSLNKSLRPEFERLTGLYEDPRGVDKVHQALDKVNQVKNVMQENVRRVMENGENMQALEAKSQQMSESAMQFNAQARELKRQQWWKNWRLIGIAVLLGGLVIGVLWWIFSSGGSSGGGGNKSDAAEEVKNKDTNPLPPGPKEPDAPDNNSGADGAHDDGGHDGEKKLVNMVPPIPETQKKSKKMRRV